MRSKRWPVHGFEPETLFGTKVETTKFFRFQKWERMKLKHTPNQKAVPGK
jgi:hypothetical protein